MSTTVTLRVAWKTELIDHKSVKCYCSAQKKSSCNLFSETKACYPSTINGEWGLLSVKLTLHVTNSPPPMRYAFSFDINWVTQDSWQMDRQTDGQHKGRRNFSDTSMWLAAHHVHHEGLPQTKFWDNGMNSTNGNVYFHRIYSSAGMHCHQCGSALTWRMLTYYM